MEGMALFAMIFACIVFLIFGVIAFVLLKELLVWWFE